MENKSLDFQDIDLDSIVMLEDRSHSEGFQAGAEAAKRQNLVDGARLGSNKGVEFSQDVGLCYGFAHRLTEESGREGSNISDRHKRIIAKLLTVSKRMYDMEPLNLDPQNASIFEDLKSAKTLLKQITAMLHIRCPLPTEEEKGLSF